VYLRSGGIGPSVYPHAQAPADTSRIYYNARRSDVSGPFSGPAAEYTNEILLGNPPPTHRPGRCSRGTPRDAGKRPKDLAAGARAEGLKLLNCFPFIFQPPAAGQLKLPPPLYIL